LIDSHNFGYVSGTSPEKEQLYGTYTPAASGMYTLKIKNSRSAASSTLLINYLDTVLLAPSNPMLSQDGYSFSCFIKTTRNFELNAGSDYANHDYWMWMGISGTYPGLTVNGVEIPLNYDLLMLLGWLNPGLIGTSFMGQLDANGKASASMELKPNFELLGLEFYYTYVVLSSGGKLPVLAASNPICVCVTLTAD
jgi:hypothetical protein